VFVGGVPRDGVKEDEERKAEDEPIAYPRWLAAPGMLADRLRIVTKRL
jgi:hypothetical protein